MKSKRSIFPPIISIIYIVTVLAFVISMFVEYKTSPAKIQARIDELARATTQNLSINPADSDEFQSAFLHSIGPISDIAGIQLSQNGYLILSLPGDLDKNSPTRSPFVTVTERSIYAQNQDAVQMKVASYLIEPSSMYTKGLIAFFVILAATLFCITYLIYVYSTEKKNYVEEPVFDEKKKIKKEEVFKATATPKEEIEVEEEIEEDTGSKEDNEYVYDDYLEPSPSAPETEPEPFRAFDDAYFAGEGAPDFPDVELFDDEELEDDTREEEQEDISDSLNDVSNEPEDLEPEVSEPTVSSDSAYSNSYNSDDSEDSGYQMPQSPSSTITQEEFQALTQDLLDDPAPEDSEEDSRIEDEDDFLDDIVDDEEEKSILPELNPIHTKLDEPVQEEVNENENKNLPFTSEKPQEPEVQDIKHPAGLFSPTTGFGWEEYMIPRLDSELIRAASGDQDLTVMTLDIPKMDWTSESAREICDLILDLVKFKDLVFEYGQSGCTAIIQNMGIEEALKAAEDLHTNIIASLARRKQYYIVGIGLSARSLRLISGSRIAKESEQALIHAMEDKSNPVVAFKVNPERYRKYIAEESAKLNKKEPQLSVTSS
ncbi:MAG: hypothetical protein J6Y69_03265 [Treponema sp.]|nr:hypothetical protein [Treponema sp.]